MPVDKSPLRSASIFMKEWAYVWAPLVLPALHLLYSKKLDYVEAIELFLGYTISGLYQLHELREEVAEAARQTGDVHVDHEMSVDVVSQKLTHAAKRIWILTSWLPSPEKIKAAIEKNVRVGKKKFDLKIIVGDKYAIRQRAAEVGEKSWETKYTANLDLSRDFSGKVTYLSTAVHKLLFIIDDEVFLSPFFYKEQAVKSPSMHAKLSSTIGEALHEEFITLWKKYHTENGDVDCDVVMDNLKPIYEKLAKRVEEIISNDALELFIVDPNNPGWITSYPDRKITYKIDEDMTGIVLGRGYAWRVPQLRKRHAGRDGYFQGKSGAWMGMPIIIQDSPTDKEFQRVGVLRLTRAAAVPFTEEDERKCQEVSSEFASEMNNILQTASRSADRNC